MKINIKVDASDCKFDPSELKARLSEALEYGAENVQRMAIEIVPKDTGDLVVEDYILKLLLILIMMYT